MEKIVVLVGKYAPIMGPSTSCIIPFLHNLKSKYEIHIVCQYDGIPSHIDDGMHIHTITNIINNYANKFKNNSLADFVIRCYKIFLSTYCFPSRDKWMINKYFEKIESINKNGDVRAVISVTNPITTHFAALKYKQVNNTFKWITYSTDPFTYYDAVYKNMIFKKHRQLRNFGEEQRIFESADYNLLTRALYKSVRDDFHLKGSKYICFPFYLKKQRTSIENSLNSKKQYIHIVYAGSLNKKIRNPVHILHKLPNRRDIIISFYQNGNCNDILSQYQYINNKPMLSKSEYLDLIYNDADILINIGNINCKYQEPSKLYELLSTGKPIINFYFEKSIQCDIIDQYPLGINICTDWVDSNIIIEDFCIKNKNTRLTFEEVLKIFPQMNYLSQLELLENIIKEN